MAEHTYHNEVTENTKDCDALLGDGEHDREEAAPTRPRPHRGWRNAVLFALLALLCILLLVDVVLRVATLTGRREDTSRIHHSFGSNESYMSLDHKFDHLWDSEFAANNAVVYIPPDGKVLDVVGDDGIEPGAITMCVIAHISLSPTDMYLCLC